MTTPTADHDPLKLTGALVDDKYRIEQAIGVGGFSVVYRAQHIIWNQPVALKCFKLDGGLAPEMREQLLDAFIQEGKLMTELSSRTSAIVQARDVGTFTRQDGSWVPYMVLEWLDGTPLDKVLESQRNLGEPPASLHDTMLMLQGAAEALALAHRRAIVHRDIKPANLFLVSSPLDGIDTIKILDFGVAKVMADHNIDPTVQHDALRAFTPRYGAPEQFSRSNGPTGPWTDVFSFALVMVEILRGGLPALEGQNLMGLAFASIDKRARPTPRNFGITVSDEVDAAFEKALAVDPMDRYATMGEFWLALCSAAGWASTIPDAASSTRFTPSVTPTGMSLAHPLVRPRRSLSWSKLIGMGVGIAMGAASLVLLGMRAAQSSALPSPADSASTGTCPQDEPAAPSTSLLGVGGTQPCPAGMIQIGEAQFVRGDQSDGSILWSPPHKVALSAYCLDRFETTTQQYESCVEKGDCVAAGQVAQWPLGEGESQLQFSKSRAAYSELCNTGRPNRESHPINCVNWQQARHYCLSLGKRLPTEAEWEYALRSSDGSAYPWGNDTPDDRHVNACGPSCSTWKRQQGLPQGRVLLAEDDGFEATSPVGMFPAGNTRAGASDMLGNVYEWTADWMAPYSDAEQVNPAGPAEGQERVIRGGSFADHGRTWLNPAYRRGLDPMARRPDVGFRCAADVQK